MFACNFGPTGWSPCNGQMMPVARNKALFAVLGYTYGGNNGSVFALPDLTASAAVCYGTGAGLAPVTLGEEGGADQVILSLAEMAAHSHKPGASGNGKVKTAAGSIWATRGEVRPEPNLYANFLSAKPITMATGILSASGGGLPHNNLMPYQGINFCIALQGDAPGGGEGEEAGAAKEGRRVDAPSGGEGKEERRKADTDQGANPGGGGE